MQKSALHKKWPENGIIGAKPGPPQYLKAYQNGPEARRGIGAYLALYNQERPHQGLGYQTPGQVFQEGSTERGLLEHPAALSSVTGTRDFRAVDSLILA